MKKYELGNPNHELVCCNLFFILAFTFLMYLITIVQNNSTGYRSLQKR